MPITPADRHVRRSIAVASAGADAFLATAKAHGRLCSRRDPRAPATLDPPRLLTANGDGDVRARRGRLARRSPPGSRAIGCASSRSIDRSSARGSGYFRAACTTTHTRAQGRRPHILLIGNDELTGVTQRALRDAGAIVTNLRDPTDAAIRTALRHDVETVVVISKDDHVSLRSALVAEGVRPGVPLVVTVFDHDVATRLESSVRNVHVISMADVVVPSIAAACLDHSPLSLHRTPAGFKAVRSGTDGPEIVPLDLPRRGRAGSPAARYSPPSSCPTSSARRSCSRASSASSRSSRSTCS